MRIGIVTIYGNENYGNKFQNYAVKKIIEKNENTMAFTILFNKTYKQRIVSLLTVFGVGKFKKLKKDIFDRKKIRKFEAFSKKYLAPKKYISKKNLNKKYDLFFAGSDQIWNDRGFYDKQLNFYLLSFADANKRIAISPSLGTGKIHNKKLFLTELPKFKLLSCRESSNVREIENYSGGKKCFKLPDPTLGLSKLEWNEIKRESIIKPNKKYIMCYFLGKIDEELEEYLDTYSKNYKIINLMEKKDIDVFSTDPGEFLDLIENADLFITDSFHGCVFSMIYNTPFVVVHTKDRIKMEDRINSILKEFNVEDRWIENINKRNVFDMNFSKINKKLDDQRKIMNDYVKGALSEKK